MKNLAEFYPWREVTKDDVSRFRSYLDPNDHWTQGMIPELRQQSPELARQVDKTVLWFNAQDVSDLTVEQFMERLADVKLNEELIAQYEVTPENLKSYAELAGVVE